MRESGKERMDMRGIPRAPGYADRRKSAVFTVLSVLLCALSAVFLSAAQRLFSAGEESPDARSLLFPALLFFLFLLCQSLAAGALASAHVCSGGRFSVHLSAVLSFCAALAVTEALRGISVFLSLLCVGYAFSAFALYMDDGAGVKRTQRVLCVAAPLAATAILGFIYAAYLHFSFAPGSLSRYILLLTGRAEEAARNLFADFARAAGGENSPALRALIGSPAAPDVLASYGEYFAAGARGLIKVAFPIFAALCCCAAYPAVLLFEKTSGRRIPRLCKRLEISFVGALFFLAGSIASLFVSLPVSGVFGTFLVGMRIIYLPAALAMGVRTLREGAKNAGRRPVLTVILVILILLRPVTVLSFIGLLGNRRIPAPRGEAFRDGVGRAAKDGEERGNEKERGDENEDRGGPDENGGSGA